MIIYCTQLLAHTQTHTKQLGLSVAVRYRKALMKLALRTITARSCRSSHAETGEWEMKVIWLKAFQLIKRLSYCVFQMTTCIYLALIQYIKKESFTSYSKMMIMIKVTIPSQAVVALVSSCWKIFFTDSSCFFSYAED